MSFLRPRDSRWRGTARWYFPLDIVKNTILFAFVILVIVEGALYRHWYMDYHSTVEFDSGETTADFFLRIGLALIPDILSTILTHTLLHTNPVRFHPIFALTQSLIIFCLYPPALFLNLLIAYSDETGYTYIDAWQALCYAEMSVQGILAIVWVSMVVCSCVAVHKWRGEKEAGKGGLELDKNNKAGKDSANLGNIQEFGDAQGSVKSARVFV